MLIHRGVCSLNIGYHGREGEGGSGIRSDMLCSGWGLRRAGELDMMIGNVEGVYMRIESHRVVEI